MSVPTATMTIFDLPLEIRIRVYEYIVQDEHRFFHGDAPAFLRTCLQITQEVYEHCEIVATVKSEAALLYMNDLDDIKQRVERYRSIKGNKSVVVRLAVHPELQSNFGIKIEQMCLGHRETNKAPTNTVASRPGTETFKSYCVYLIEAHDAPAEQKLDLLQKVLEAFDLMFTSTTAKVLGEFVIAHLGMEDVA